MKAIQSIKAIQYRAYGAYAENRFVDLPAPAANDGQVLVRMHTAESIRWITPFAPATIMLPRLRICRGLAVRWGRA